MRSVLSLWKDLRRAPNGPGVALIGNTGQSLEPRQAIFGPAIGFSLSDVMPDKALASEQIEVALPALLRLDEVSFPPGAVAYRHTHPGPGFRYLRRGRLTLEAEHSFTAVAGDWWFEPANAPVRATAGTDAETRFVRGIVLPADYLGKSSFTLCDPADAALERRQTTHRHVDLILEA